MHSDRGENGPVKLGEFQYDPIAARLMDRTGEQVFLRAQSAAVLKILFQNIGELVTRDALISEVWPDLNVTDDSLTQCIADIRRALGDHERRIVRTVPKRGFILQAPTMRARGEHQQVVPSEGFQEVAGRFERAGSAIVCAIVPGADENDILADLQQAILGGQLTGPTIPAGCRTTFPLNEISPGVRRALQAASACRAQVGIEVSGDLVADPHGLALLAAPGQVIVTADVRDASFMDPGLDFEDLGDLILPDSKITKRVFRANLRSALMAVPARLLSDDVLPTIAVIPLRPLDSGSPDAMLGEFIASEINAALSKTRDANVISRMSSAPFQTQIFALRDVSSLLGADFIVSGQFRAASGRLLLHLELASAETQHILWSERIEIDQSALFNGFAEANEIVGRICKAIVLSEIRQAQSQPVENLRNYSVLYGAVGLMHRLSPKDFAQAKSLLDALIERVPYQPAPYAWSARWFVLKVMQGWSENPQEDANQALDCASRALEVDPENVLALTSTGFVLTNLMHRLDEAEETYDIALDSNPNDANGRALRGMLFAFQDRGKEGVADTERALRLAPLDPHKFFFLALAAGANLAAEDYARALELTKASLRLNRTHASTLRMLVATNMLTGDESAARAALPDLLALQPGLRVSTWLGSSPSADFKVGRRIAEALRAVGVPE